MKINSYPAPARNFIKLAMKNITPKNPKVKQKITQIQNLPPSAIFILDSLLSFSNNHRKLFMSRAHLAFHSMTSVRSITRYLPVFVSLGLISLKSGKPNYTTNKYKISSIFCDLDFRNALKEILPSLKKLPIALFLLYSINATVLDCNPITSSSLGSPKCFSLYFNEDCSTKYYFEEQDSRSFTKNIHKGERLTPISTPSVCPNLVCPNKIKDLLSALSSVFSTRNRLSLKPVNKDVYYQKKPSRDLTVTSQSMTDQSKTEQDLSSKTYAKEEFIANPFMDMLLSKNIVTQQDLNKKSKK